MTLAVSAISAVASLAADAPSGSPAPAFSAKQLTTPPTSAWITNGGTIFNQRYSPLTEINRDTVGQMKAVWRTSLNGSGTSQHNSAEAQPIYYDGVLYISTGDDDVFAVSVDTGAILWSYAAHVDPHAGVTCCGWGNRGVAIGDGKVFIGQLDGKIVALDQKTGKVAWETQAERWQDGLSITAAPLYYDGMIITGFSGGEMAARGRVKAFDAKTGKLKWTFYTVPEPGQPGHETWPADNELWTRGGAPVWQTPAVDPELGMVYFSTGNPGPDLNGSFRPGNNLFSVSIVALDAHTGAYKWHFQEVHHDLWDYDAPNPIVLFDATVDGKMRRGLVEVGKTGFAYILDRETGKPLIGIDEKPVAQEPRQATAATQPFPVGDPIVPQAIDADPDGMVLANEGRIFTPFWTDPVAVKPGTMGGANWPPSAYDPDTHLLYVCATDRISVFKSDGKEIKELPAPNTVFMGGNFGQANVNDRGILAALDVTTNKLIWRQQWRDICYSGAVATGGGLLFVGRNDGRLTALDKANGRLLWAFQTDGGVNSTVTTFTHKGHQMVAVLAGGAVFATSKRNDGLWLFSLNGTTKSLPPGSAAFAAAPGGPPRGGISAGLAATQVAAKEGAPHVADAAHGADLYFEACEVCHGGDGKGGHGGGPALTALSREEILATATAGRNAMPAFASIYKPDELSDVAAYIVEKLAKK
jgi:alcohol dehydrogenase (cytochrome c)